MKSAQRVVDSVNAGARAADMHGVTAFGYSDAIALPVYVCVPAVPVAQPRPRAVLRKGAKRAGVIGAPTEHPVHAFKASVAHAWRAFARSAQPIEGPLELRVLCVFPRPEKLNRKGATERVWYTGSRNDWDNCGKSIADALNAIAWRDDGQVCIGGPVLRCYAAKGEAPHVEFVVSRPGSCPQPGDNWSAA